MLPREFYGLNKEKRKEIVRQFEIGEDSIYYPIPAEKANKSPFSKRFLVYCKDESVIGLGVGSEVTIFDRKFISRKQLIEGSDVVYYVSKTNIKKYSEKVCGREEQKNFIKEKTAENVRKYSEIYNNYIAKLCPVFVIGCERKEEQLFIKMKNEINRLSEQGESGYNVCRAIEKITYEISKNVEFKIECKKGRISQEHNIESFAKVIENIKDFIERNHLEFSEVMSLKNT